MRKAHLRCSPSRWGAVKVAPHGFFLFDAKAPGRLERARHLCLSQMRELRPYGTTATPQGRRPTGTDFSAFRLATSMIVMSLVSPFAT